MSNVSDHFYLVVRRAKNNYSRPLSFRMTHNAPTTKGDEVAMKIDVSLPVALFSKPTLEASVTVPADKVGQTVIPADVEHNVVEIVKQATGLDLHITVSAAKPSKKD